MFNLKADQFIILLGPLEQISSKSKLRNATIKLESINYRFYEHILNTI